MHENNMVDSVKVYFDTRDEEFLIVAEAKMGYGRIETNKSDFESRIGEVIVRFLDSFETNSCSAEESRRYSDEEYRSFQKRHVSINIERLSSGELIVQPLHHEGSGYVGTEGEQIIVDKKDIPAKIPSALRDALNLAN